MQAPNGSLFPAAIFTLYCTYLAYSALVAEPHDYECNGLGHRITAASASTLALGMGLALLSVVYSALRAGSNTALFNLAQSVGAADEVRSRQLPTSQPLQSSLVMTECSDGQEQAAASSYENVADELWWLQADRPLLSNEAKEAEEGTSAGLDGESRSRGEPALPLCA